MLRPLEGFPPELFAGRRARVLDGLGRSAMVLPATPVRYSSRDTEYPYRPDSELFWVTGVVEPEAVAVLRGHADGERFVLFVRPRDPEAERWAGPRQGPEGAKELYGADLTLSTEELESRLPDLLAGADTVHFRLGRAPLCEGLVLAALQTARRRGPRKGEGPRGVLDPGTVLDDLRLVKDAREVARLREAATITAEAHREAMARCRPGMAEYEIQAILEAAFRRRGADGPGYGTIVGGGRNGCFLHYVDNVDTLEAGELVLVDAGAALGLYTADITRTFPVDGRFGPAQRVVYEMVETARRAAVAAVRPGASLADVHGAAARVLVEGLRAEGVLEGDPEALLADEAHKPFYPHQTSHWLGLDVHDPGDYARDGRSRTLAAGMVLTVEPGLYFGPGTEDAAGPFAGIGVRIEDDVVVTEDGCELLTEDVPTDADEVGGLVGSG